MKNKKNLFLIFLIVLILVFSFYFFGKKFLSLKDKESEDLIAQYKRIEDTIRNYEGKLSKDFDGGKTPEETLKFFREALKNNDIDLALKYVVIDNKNSREKWRQILTEAKEKGDLPKIIEAFSSFVYDKEASYEKVAWFKLFNSSGEHVGDILLELNEKTGVWKISGI